MNLNALEHSLKGRIGELYRAKHPAKGVVVEGYDERIARVQALQERMRRHRALIELRNRNRSHKARMEHNIREARAMLRGDAIFMSLDVEGVSLKKKIEFGVTIYEEGRMTSFNYRTPEALAIKTPFEYGETEILPWEEIAKRLTEHAQQASAYVGHSLHSDLEFLKECGLVLPKLPYYDTAWWSTLNLGPHDGLMKLTDACDLYGVGCSDPHCGGNDSRYTLELFLAMIEKHAA